MAFIVWLPEYLPFHTSNHPCPLNQLVLRSAFIHVLLPMHRYKVQKSYLNNNSACLSGSSVCYLFTALLYHYQRETCRCGCQIKETQKPELNWTSRTCPVAMSWSLGRNNDLLTRSHWILIKRKRNVPLQHIPW